MFLYIEIKGSNIVFNFIVYKLNVLYFLWNCEKLFDIGILVILRILIVNEFVNMYYVN